jgi:hypothetical protein
LYRGSVLIPKINPRHDTVYNWNFGGAASTQTFVRAASTHENPVVPLDFAQLGNLVRNLAGPVAASRPVACFWQIVPKKKPGAKPGFQYMDGLVSTGK